MNHITKKDRCLASAAWCAVAAQALLLSSNFLEAASAEAPEERVLRKQVEVSASVEDVWHAWTMADGIASFFAPRAEIELRIGGKYELYIKPNEPEGQREDAETQKGDRTHHGS